MYNRILTAIIFLAAFSGKTFAQDLLTDALKKDSKRDTKTYTLISLDGKSKKVYIMPDYVNRTLKISCLKDTINVNDFWDVPPETHILNKNFLSIKYEVRGGSNLGLGNVLILCVKANALYEAMHVLRYSSSEGSNSETGEEKIEYNIRPVLFGNSAKTYQLKVKVHSSNYSQYEPSANFNYNNISVLKFDLTRNVFYSLKKDIYQTMTIYDIKTNKEKKQEIRGNFPEIILGDENYYFIKDGWYRMGTNNELYNFTSTTRK
jgi:hypothetical protein